MLPVRDVGLDEPGVVVEDGVDRLASPRGRGWGSWSPDLSRLQVGEDAVTLDIGEVRDLVGDGCAAARKASGSMSVIASSGISS